jgi:hypothetical protein
MVGYCALPFQNFESEGRRAVESPDSAALVIAAATLVIATVFVLYAWSGADLCVWCGALGR